MRKILFVIIIVWSKSLFCVSQNVQVSDAKMVATQFMKSVESIDVNIESITPIYKNDNLVYYIVNFNENKGWTIVSATTKTQPIFAYSTSGNFREVNTLPPPLIQLLSSYKQEVLMAIVIDSTFVNEEWNNYLSPTKRMLKSASYYMNEDYFLLLDIPSRGGEVLWDQNKNSEGTCMPSYNKFCPKPIEIFGECGCDGKALAGCGAVAMGQIMWKWEWPNSYPWRRMPTQLKDGDSDDIPRLLRDCGIKSNMNYFCSGSFTTLDNLVEAFDDFNYKFVTGIKQKGWNYGNVWEDIIRTELDCGRPVLYRGGEVIEKGDMGSVHYFVIEGYNHEAPNFFYINWGWGWGNNLHTEGNTADRYSLPKLTPYGPDGSDYPDDETDFSDNAMAIIGISPTLKNVPNMVNSLNLTTVSDYENIVAKQNLIIQNPKTNKISVAENGTICARAGISIYFPPEFEVSRGGTLYAEIDADLAQDCDIEIISKTNGICMNTVSNHDFVVFPKNANSYSITVFDRRNKILYQGAGLITDRSKNSLWDGTGVQTEGVYMVELVLRNNCGEALREICDVTAFYGCRETSTKSYNIESAQIDEDTLLSVNETPMEKVVIYPNPTTGRCYIEVRDVSSYSYKIYNSNGQIIVEKDNIYSPVDCFNIPDNIQDYCVVEVKFDNQKVYRKLILKK